MQESIVEFWWSSVWVLWGFYGVHQGPWVGTSFHHRLGLCKIGRSKPKINHSMRPIPVSEAWRDGLHAPEEEGALLDKAGLAGAKIPHLGTFTLKVDFIFFPLTSVIK